MRRLIAIAVSTLCMAALPALAQEEAAQVEAAQQETAPKETAEEKKAPKAKSLDELLRQVQAGWRGERAEMQRRENEFKQARQEQERLLAEAKATRLREEKRSEEMELTFEENETRIAERPVSVAKVAVDLARQIFERPNRTARRASRQSAPSGVKCPAVQIEQQVSRNATSSAACSGRSVTEMCRRNRIVKRCLPALISGNTLTCSRNETLTSCRGRAGLRFC